MPLRVAALESDNTTPVRHRTHKTHHQCLCCVFLITKALGCTESAR